LIFWDPPEFQINYPISITDRALPLDQFLGSPNSYVLTARLMNDMLKRNNKAFVEEIKPDKPVSILSWKLKNGDTKILTGNLEEGINHTSDQSVSINLIIPQISGNGNKQVVLEWDNSSLVISDKKLPIHLNAAESKLYIIKSD
jgi:hypothetical protein